MGHSLHVSPLSLPVEEASLVDEDVGVAELLQLPLPYRGSLAGPQVKRKLEWQVTSKKKESLVRSRPGLPAGQDQILVFLVWKVKAVLFFKLSAAHLKSCCQLRQGNIEASWDLSVFLQLVWIPDVHQESTAVTELGCQLVEGDNSHGGRFKLTARHLEGDWEEWSKL